VTITAAELARRIGVPEHRAVELLAELEAAGQAEQHDGGWRLTTSARRSFGDAFGIFAPVADLGGGSTDSRLDVPADDPPPDLPDLDLGAAA
jgi:hypothetical protein